MPDPRSLTRRDVLRLGVGCGIVGLAGCGASEAEAPSATPTEAASVFQTVGVDGDFLVVELADSDALSTVNLIAPDGTLYGQQRVQSGVRTVRFRLIELEFANLTHYSPGEYRIVAVDDNEQVESQDITLRPNLQIRRIMQHREKNSPKAKTHLAVLVENTGTAPTWIYDITYENAPYWGANKDLLTNQGISYLYLPDEKQDLILAPGQKQTYVSSDRALLFSDRESTGCDVSTVTSVLLGTGYDTKIEQRVRLRVKGQENSLGGFGEYACSDVSVEILGSQSESTRTDNIRNQ